MCKSGLDPINCKSSFYLPALHIRRFLKHIMEYFGSSKQESVTVDVRDRAKLEPDREVVCLPLLWGYKIAQVGHDCVPCLFLKPEKKRV